MSSLEDFVKKSRKGFFSRLESLSGYYNLDLFENIIIVLTLTGSPRNTLLFRQKCFNRAPLMMSFRLWNFKDGGSQNARFKNIDLVDHFL